MTHTEKFIRDLIKDHNQDQTTMAHVQTTLCVLRAGFKFLADRSNDPNLVQIVNDFSTDLTTEFFKILEKEYVLSRKVD